uniref:Uncharacterized protein n=1 Tax=Lepeophtheirus salmonis TaxID=72036 RepID=A0A0K2TD01_LEPSM
MFTISKHKWRHEKFLKIIIRDRILNETDPDQSFLLDKSRLNFFKEQN